MKRYAAFLITSPIINSRIQTRLSGAQHDGQGVHRSPLPKPQIPHEYGSYHCQYWLDGEKLIAVGVLDILTTCITSVYLYYDPEFSFLKLGVYSALREIDMVRRLYKYNESIKNYYMGFYIHSCPKMSYKIKYQPSSLLCQETNIFIDSLKCIEKLNNSKYARFSPNDDGTSFKLPTLDDIGKILVKDGKSLTTMRKFIEALSKLNISVDRLIEAVLEYSQLVGDYISGRMILGTNTLRQEYLSNQTGKTQ